MPTRKVLAAALVALAVSAPHPAGAGFWGDLKRSFGGAVDNAQRDGARAVDAVGKAAGDAADHVTGGSDDTAAQPADPPADAAADPADGDGKQLSKRPKQ